MEVLEMIADHVGDICQIATFAALLIKPVREWLLGTEVIREGQRCLLRAEIVRIYYRNKDVKQLLGGNSFVDHIYAEMLEWDII